MGRNFSKDFEAHLLTEEVQLDQHGLLLALLSRDLGTQQHLESSYETQIELINQCLYSMG